MGIMDRDIRGVIGSPMVSSSGSGSVSAEGVQVDYHTVTAPEITAKGFDLSYTPSQPTKVLLDLIGGSAQIYGVDFVVVTDAISWTGLALDGELIANDVLRVSYSASDVVEYRTLTGGEIAAFGLTLASTPIDGLKVKVDVIGGSAQVYTVDFTVSGTTLDWTGLGMAGEVVAGDILRIVYEG